MSVVVSSHAVKVTAEPVNPEKLLVQGDTLYYSSLEEVSVDLNDGAILAGDSRIFTQPQWLISAGESAVNFIPTASAESVDAEDWHYVGAGGEPAFENSWLNQVTIYTLDLSGVSAGQIKLHVTDYGTTANIAYNASAATIDSALEAVVGAGNVSIVDEGGSYFAISFVGSLSTTAITMTLENGTTPPTGSGVLSLAASPGIPMRFYKQAERVYLEGDVTQPGVVGTSSATIFTLPAGYRPDRQSALGGLRVETSGSVHTASAATGHAITTGSSFRVA